MDTTCGSKTWSVFTLFVPVFFKTFFVLRLGQDACLCESVHAVFDGIADSVIRCFYLVNFVVLADVHREVGKLHAHILFSLKGIMM